jgi:hypothetical protein
MMSYGWRKRGSMIKLVGDSRIRRPDFGGKRRGSGRLATDRMENVKLLLPQQTTLVHGGILPLIS